MKNILIKYSFNMNMYHLSLSQWIRIKQLDVKLLIRKILRFLKRVYIYLKPVLTVAILGLIFTFVISFIGIKIGKYVKWYDGIWDLKTFILTSIFIAASISIIQGEREHKKDLQLQLDLYQSTMWEFEQLINGAFQALTKETLYNTDIFMNNENLNYFKETVECYINSFKDRGAVIDEIGKQEFYDQREIDTRIYLIATFKALENQIRLLRTKKLYVVSSYGSDVINNNNIEQWLDMNLFISYLETNENLLVSDVLEYILSCASYLYLFIAVLRTPWRYDYDMKIRSERLAILENATSTSNL